MLSRRALMITVIAVLAILFLTALVTYLVPDIYPNISTAITNSMTGKGLSFIRSYQDLPEMEANGPAVEIISINLTREGWSTSTPIPNQTKTLIELPARKP